MRASLVAQMVKNLPTIQETRVQSLGWQDPLEKGMATHSSILAWRIPWTEEPGRLHSPWGCKQLDMTGQLTLSLFQTHKKSAKFLNLGYLVFFNLPKIYLPFVAKLLYNLAPPLASSEQFSWGHLRCFLRGLKS